MDRLKQLERTRARAGVVRVVKLAGQNRYLARSRTYEPGSYFDLTSAPGAMCAAPAQASPTEASASTLRPSRSD